jgi:hypothetical protein
MLTALRAVNRNLTERLTAATYPYGGNDPDAGHTDFGQYRRVGGAKRDLPSVTVNEIRERALWMRQQNPLARRYVDLLRELVTSAEWEVRAEEEAVQGVLDTFWAGPYNRWPDWLGPYSDVLACTGVLALPVWCNPVDGEVQCLYADPTEIRDILPTLGNPRILKTAIWERKGKDVAAPDPIELTIVNPVTNRKDPNYGLLMGDNPRKGSGDKPTGLLYFRANALPNETQGLSDLSAAIDELANHNEYMAAQLEMAMILGRFIGSIKLVGGQQDAGAVQETRDRYRDTPAFASVNVHNEGEEHTYSAVPTHGADAADRDRMHGNYATASMGIPPHIIRGDMGEGNRAIATQANDPAYLKVAAHIKAVKLVAMYSCQYALDCAKVCGKLPAGVDDAFTITTPQVLKKDLAVGATTLEAASRFLVAAEQREWLSRSHAQELFVRLLPELGADDITLEDVQARLEDEGPANAGFDPMTRMRMLQMQEEGEEDEQEEPPA